MIFLRNKSLNNVMNWKIPDEKVYSVISYEKSKPLVTTSPEKTDCIARLSFYNNAGKQL